MNPFFNPESYMLIKTEWLLHRALSLILLLHLCRSKLQPFLRGAAYPPIQVPRPLISPDTVTSPPLRLCIFYLLILSHLCEGSCLRIPSVFFSCTVNHCISMLPDGF